MTCINKIILILFVVVTAKASIGPWPELIGPWDVVSGASDTLYLDSIRGGLTGDSTVYVGDTAFIYGGFPATEPDTVQVDTFNIPVIGYTDSVFKFIVPDSLDTGLCTLTVAYGVLFDTLYFFNLGEIPLAPSITTQPVNIYARNGTQDSMYVEYSGNDETITPQWQDSISAWANIAGATDSVLTLTITTAMEGRKYRCVITDNHGSDTSAVATVDVWSVFTLTASSGTGGSATGSGDYDSSIATSVTAPADPGYVFVYWTTESGTVVWGDSTSASTTVAISENSEVQANFNAIISTDSIRPNPQYRLDSCSWYGVGAGASGTINNLTTATEVSQKSWSDTQIDFYTGDWLRGWQQLEFISATTSLRDTFYLRIVIPRKTN